MQTRTLGPNGPKVSALERGITFFDTADVYGPYTNEQLLGQALAGRRALRRGDDAPRARLNPGL